MYIQNRIAAIALRCLCLYAAAYSLTVLTDVLHGGYTHRMLAYYTNLSSIVLMFYLFASIFHTGYGLYKYGNRGTSTLFTGLKRAFVMMVTITFLVYHFILVPTAFRMNLTYHVHSLPDILIHYVVPLGFILDWLLFDEKGKTRWFDPLTWLLLPLAYLVFVYIRAEVGQPLNSAGVRFPYFFLDIDRLPAGQVAAYIAICAAAVVVIGYFYMFLDRLLTRARSLANLKARDHGNQF